MDISHTNEKREWLIWNFERNMWWKSNMRGYTPERDRAGKYFFKEALLIIDKANKHCSDTDSPEDAMVHYDIIKG